MFRIKITRGLCSALIILVISGCSNNDALIEKQQEEEALIEKQQDQIEELKGKIETLENTIKTKQKELDNYEKQFSYLHDLTTEELQAYERFAKDKDAQHLSGLSPDKIVLIYLQSVVIDDVEAIYSLTYDNGELPDSNAFRDKYYTEGFDRKEMETTLDYRYYNSIEVIKDTKTENEVAVKLNVNYYNFSAAMIYGLKKENGIWKMDILPVMEHLKETHN